MSFRRKLPDPARLAAAVGLAAWLLVGSPLAGATFNWVRNSNGNASGSWANQANWSGGTLPTTTSDTGAFNTLDITSDSTITLDGPQAINALSFADAGSGTGASWFLKPGHPSSSTLTLGGSNPSISAGGLAVGEATVINAVIAGTNGLTKAGTSFLQLNAANIYSGKTVLSGSDCRVSVGNNHAFGSGKIVVGANPGDGQVWFQPAGPRMLTNDVEVRTIRWIIDWNTANGIAGGDLTLNGNILLNAGGSNVRDIYCGENLTLNGSMTVNPLSNPFNKQGGSTLTLNGTNTFSGPTAISAGTLVVNGSLNSPGPVTIANGATLSGTGVVGGTVLIEDGGTLLVGNGGSGTLIAAGCVASANATITFALGATNNPANGFLKLNGNLTLDGLLKLNDLGGFSSGVYTGMWYSGTLVDRGLTVSGAPSGKTVAVDVATPHYVLFRVLDGQVWPAAGDAVPMDMASPLVLSWLEGVDAMAYDVFLGTSSNAVYAATTNTPDIYQGRTGTLTNAISGLQPNRTYYWRVDSVSAAGTPTKGAVMSFTTGNAMEDLMQDTWVATDALNRTLPGYADCGAPRNDQPIGIFYFLWHTANSLGSDGPRDNTREIQRLGGYSDPHNPWADNPLWMSGANARSWYWGEPEDGYYANDDEWVIRRHVAMLEAAGVDVLGFDTTNGHPENHAPKYLKIMEVIRKMRLEGTPVHLKVFHYTHATSPATVTWLYDNFYKQGLYRDLWFVWQGKPLIIGYPDGLSPGDGSVSAEVRNFFTWRTGWAYVSGTLENEWQWIDRPTPQNFGWNSRKDVPEQLPVACGGWANGNLGRSQFNNTQPAYDNYHLSVGRTEGQGLFFSEQAFYGLKYDPQFLWIVGWNEWWAGAWDASTYCYTRLLADCVPAGKRYFVDNYNAEYSRDIEPMKGGFTDTYYYQMVGYNRLRKGVRPVPAASAPKTINLAGDFSDWADVGPEFRDYAGDTVPRNHASTFSNLPNYTDTTGRNDFTLLKVARDADYFYFLAQCRSNLTSYTDTNWLVLFLNTDQSRETGWEGYDFAVNLGPRAAGTTSLSRNTTATNGWTWTTLRSDLPWKATGNQFMVRVPRADLGLTNEPVAFDFHWADNFQTNDISGFFLYGDSAPDRRFNYRYHASVGIPVTLRQDDFDAGKQAWWDESWTNGSKWNLTSAGSYSGSAAQCSIGNGTGQSALITRADTSALESFRLSFRYKLTNVLDAQSFNVQFLTATGWVSVHNLGRDEFHPASQSWGYDEQQNVWMTFAAAYTRSGTNARFFHRDFAVRLDGSGIISNGQAVWIDNFLLTGVRDDASFGSAPSFPPIPNQTVIAGQTLLVTNAASDPDSPPELLSFSALNAPANATVDPLSGVFTWRPTIAQSPLVTRVQLKVEDNGQPPLSATQSFWVTVNRPAPPQLVAVAWTNGALSLHVSGDAGPDYAIQGATNLRPPTAWVTLLATNSPPVPFRWADPQTNLAQRFYRVILGP